MSVTYVWIFWSLKEETNKYAKIKCMHLIFNTEYEHYIINVRITKWQTYEGLMKNQFGFIILTFLETIWVF